MYARKRNMKKKRQTLLPVLMTVLEAETRSWNDGISITIFPFYFNF